MSFNPLCVWRTHAHPAQVVAEDSVFEAGDWDFLMQSFQQPVAKSKPCPPRGTKLGGSATPMAMKAMKVKKSGQKMKAMKVMESSGELNMSDKCIHSRAYKKIRAYWLAKGVADVEAKRRGSKAGKDAVQKHHGN